MTNEQLLEVIRRQPGIATYVLANTIKAKTAQVRQRLIALEKQGAVERVTRRLFSKNLCWRLTPNVSIHA